MSPTGVDAFDRAQHTAHAWLADVAEALGTDDHRYAYRVLRAWLHTLRDRLTIETAVAFGAQLPELLRGVYYDGWQPHRAPIKYHPEEYPQRFATEARIPPAEAGPAAAAITAAIAARMSPGQLDETLAQLPAHLQTLIRGGTPPTPAPAVSGPAPHATPETVLADLEARIDVLTEAVRTLATGFEEEPGRRVNEQRRAHAARLAAEILMTGEIAGEIAGQPPAGDGEPR
jgi:uncharacterized protein (DUF2267 family)